MALTIVKHHLLKSLPCAENAVACFCERSWEFQVAGLALVVLGGLIGYGVYVG
jgi:hypothetical protein